MGRSIIPYVAALSLVVAGCKDDLKPTTSAWNTVTAEWQSKVDALKTVSAEQAAKLVTLCSSEGLDPTNVASKTCAELKVAQQSDKDQLEALVAGMTRNRAVVDKAVSRGKLLEVQVAIESAKNEMTMLIARGTDNQQLRVDALKGLEVAVTTEVEAAKTAAAAAEAKAQLWREAATEKKPLELTAIRFIEGTSQLEGTEAGEQTDLKDLTAWANTCPGLTFSITAHSSKELTVAEAQKLTTGRAQAVKKYLIDNGVPPTRIAGAVGNGAKKPIADEPEPNSEVAKALNPAELESLRNKNRRVTIQAVTACPEGERADLVQP